MTDQTTDDVEEDVTLFKGASNNSYFEVYFNAIPETGVDELEVEKLSVDLRPERDMSIYVEIYNPSASIPLIVTPGGMGEIDGFAGFARNVAAGAPDLKVIIWDRRNMGRSGINFGSEPLSIEEAYEVADAIERGDNKAICDELGDLLIQVVFQAQIAKDLGLFNFEDVAESITQKMIRRHPHVFGDLQFASEQDQKAHWEAIKAEERADANDSAELSALDGVAVALPALTRAEKIQKRASRVGMDWPDVQPVTEKLHEEILELQIALEGSSAESVEEELGDVLFTVCNLARHIKIDPEQALKKATVKFERRFRQVETDARSDGNELSDLSVSVLDQYWQQAKAIEKTRQS